MVNKYSKMSEMQEVKSNQNGKNKPTGTKAAFILSLLSGVLILGLIVIPAAPAQAEAKFKINVQICCVGSDSGSVKIKVKLPDGTATSKKVNLAKLADEQDWDNVDIFIKLKHRYESFRVCVSGLGCQWGEAGDPVQFRGYD